MKKSLLNQALQIAESKLLYHTEESFLHWSFVVQRNKILDYGTNCKLIPPIHLGYHRWGRATPPKTHSEVRAYHKAKGLLDDKKEFQLINVRLTKSGEIRNSQPCECCYNLLKELGCCKFYFSTSMRIFLSCA